MAPRSNLGRQMNNFQNFEDNQIQALGAISKSLQDTSRLITDAGDNMRVLSNAINSMTDSRGGRRSLESLMRAEQEGAESVKKRSRVLSAVMDDAISKFRSLANAVAETSDRYADLSNRMIQATGASGASVRDSRGEIVHGIIGELNAQTGNFFNPEKSYAKMLEIANTANIGSIEAIEELARPMLLATETMNVNQGQLATLLNKWYTRYNFSSAGMESMLDEIRGNTAGNNATAEATMKNLETVQSWMSYYSNGNASKLEEWSKSLSKGTSWLESMNVDTSRYADYMKKIMTGEALTDTSMITLLGYSNLSGHDAQAMAASGQMEELMKALFDAETNMFASVMNDTSVKKQVADVYGQDIDNLVDAYNARYNNQNYVDLEEFKELTNTLPSMEETADTMYVTWKDQMSNIVSSLSEFASEKHWSDILSILTSIYTVLVIRGGLGRGALSGGLGTGARGLIGSWSTAATGGLGTGASTTGLLGALEMGGFNASGGALTGGAAAGLGAASALGVVGGLAGSIYGVSAGVKDFKQGNYGTGSANLAGGVAMGAGGAALGASLLGVGAANVWNPVGWALLIGGGVTLLGTAIYKNAHALSGNAEKVSAEIDSIGENLKRENDDRLDRLGTLQYQFDKETEISERRKLMEESHIFSQEELNDTADDELQKLIDSYKNAAQSFDETTEKFLKKAEEKYADQQGREQKDFLSDLSSLTSNEDRLNALDLMYDDLDPELQKKIDKAKKANWWTGDEENVINTQEWNDIINGGANKWFDNNNLTDKSISASKMQSVDGLFGFDNTYTSTSNMYDVVKLYSNWSNAPTKAAALAAWKAIEDSGLQEELMNIYEDDINRIKDARGYDVGSNYIDSDQLANIHEGEAVVPKKYNPSANVTELEMLRKYYKDSSSNETSALTNSMKEFSSMMSEIKEFLEYWKDDNDKRSAAQERLSRMSYNTRQIAQYKMV